MIDVDEILRSELERWLPADSRSDWDEVAAGAGLTRARRLRRAAIAIAAFTVATVLGVGTPLGAALVHRFDDFSAWLTGQPGTPASDTEQQAFEDANTRTWLRFPKGTQLRHLISTQANGSTIELLGFRSGTSALCLRLHVTGKARQSMLQCAPLAELRRAGGPVRPVLIDASVGTGEKTVWYGIDRVRSSQLQITAGIASDAVRSVVLEDKAGRHEVDAVANAFLYVAANPDVGQHVTRIWARTNEGLVEIPFAQALRGYGGGSPAKPARAAPTIEREIKSGRISWLEQHEPRGDSIEILPADLRGPVLGHRGGIPGGPKATVLYGRVLTPDPDRPARVVLTLNAHRPTGPPAGLCTWFVTRSSSGGGCSPYPAVFHRTLIPTTLSGGGPGEFATATGAASDDVVKIEALLADGQRAEVPLKDSAFMVDLPRANLPARLVAYDSAGRVIDVSEPLGDFAPRSGPARGRANSVLRVNGANGANAELLVGPSSDGGECYYVKQFLDRSHRGVGVNCSPPRWSRQAMELSWDYSPTHFISGRVRPDIKTVRIRFADGTATTLIPKRGYILWAASKDHLTARAGATVVEGLRANGSVVARRSLALPRRKR
jgi:hypothetical protein